MRDSNKLLSTQNMIKIAFLSVIAAILMQWGIKLPALFPSFLEIDFSEVPALVAILAVNPWAGIIVVIVKNVLKALLFGTSTGYVGELANMVIAIGYILPLTLIARKHKDIKQSGSVIDGRLKKRFRGRVKFPTGGIVREYIF